MFTPNTKLIRVAFNVQAECALDDAFLCWSPALKMDIFLDADNFNSYSLVETTDKPTDYTGEMPIDQDWVILANKSGNKNQIFWTSADQFTPGDAENMEFISNDGLDIDLPGISFEYDSSLVYSSKDNSNSWDIGCIDDLEEGKVTLYSGVESNDPMNQDEDGDDVFQTIPQEKFEAIRQLFIRAGFNVKIKRYPRK